MSASMGFGVQSAARKNPQPRLKISHLPRASPAHIAENLRFFVQTAGAGKAGQSRCGLEPHTMCLRWTAM